ncbi:acetylglutamate kinase [Sulfoacidibacillus thermotolerans]|uniref:Acetylglutamate kinase n=1 Tax=Sulfoacidibacillus thermotolerans TaxID=1765684 RepID=A0A2U3D8Q3_SULT2|nr:acetylglutamate kinase [Sulfoacidibacillus thermotolerans]PWI57649.1 acetylglutamate kinase [Sulfoacidibacillus thermotolerans]
MQTLVVKYGGSVSEEHTFLLEEIAYYARNDVHVVVVHGGGPEVTQWLSRLGHATEFAKGQRITDELALQVVEMVLSGRVGKRIVRQLQKYGVRALSLCGEDAGMVRAVPYENGLLGYVGQVEMVDVRLLCSLLADRYVPVIAPLGVDANGQVYNINADFVAASLAGALRADAFVLATDVAGVREHANSQHTLEQLTEEEAISMVEDGRAIGGMIPKLQAVVHAVQSGAKAAYVLDGRMADALHSVMEGRSIGTRIIPTGIMKGGVEHA